MTLTLSGSWTEGGSGQTQDKRGGIFEYEGDRTLRWKAAAESGQLWVAGFWRVPWDFQSVRVKTLDTEKRTIAMEEPVQLGIGSKYAGPEGSGKEPWHVINLLEEIDMPGEWCVDFKARTLYFWPPEKLSQASISIADFSSPLVRMKDSSGITLSGLVLEGGAGRRSRNHRWQKLCGGWLPDLPRGSKRPCDERGAKP